MNIKPEGKIISEEEINLYDYWKVLIKRKKIFIGIFLVPLVTVTMISLIQPRYYRGESEITNPIIPARDIVNLIGDIDADQKIKIFTNNPDTIKSVSISLHKTSFTNKAEDKLNIIVDVKTADIIPQIFQDIYEYIANLKEIKEKIAKKNEEISLAAKNLIEAKKANLIFLNQTTDMMNNQRITFYCNPADLIKKDAEMSSIIMNLQSIKVTAGILGPLSITRQPSRSQIEQRIIMTGLLSLIAGIFVVLFLDYIERMKTRETQ